MRISKNTKLYHGSYVVIERPDLDKCHDGKDFGRGFYLTTDLEQARRFTRMAIRKAKRYGQLEEEQIKGYVSEFRCNINNELKAHYFLNADAAWLHCVTAHRKAGTLPEETSKWEAFDILGGKIANDRTNAVVTAYINGLYGDIGSKNADDTAIRLLEPDNLKDQLCFRTNKAIETLKYVGCEEVENE